MIQFGWIEHGLVDFAFQSPHNYDYLLLDLFNYTGMCSNVLSRIWRKAESCINT